MTLAELNEININELGNAPLFVRGIIITALALLVLALGIQHDSKKIFQQFEQSQQKEHTLKLDFEAKAAKAANLTLYQTQLDEMREILGTLLQQLPSEAEIPELIVDISQTALSNGLKINLFKPGQESQQDFYSEKPIELVMQGSYHQFAMFASDIAALPRIVTLHDIKLQRDEHKQMTMHALAKTYRYLNQDAE